jgi:hypothetical protein
MLVQPRNNSIVNVGRTYIRRKATNVLVFEDTVANIKASNGVFANATTHQWSAPWDFAEYTELTIEFNNLVGTSYGTIVSALMQFQIYEAKTSTYINYGATQTVTSAGFTTAAPIGLATLTQLNFGDIIRAGITCTNTSTNDGYIDIFLKGKA